MLSSASVLAAGILLVQFTLHVYLCMLNQQGFLSVDLQVKLHAKALPGALH